jgi:hypothetical protein
MKYIFLVIYIIVGIGFLWYLLRPSPGFPPPPHDAVQSMEEADTETSYRRAYFTDYTRDDVMRYYTSMYGDYFIRLNYPPEDAQTLIRDQTRSTFLEEITLPFRDSFYINGFEPKDPKDDIWYKGRHFRQKIIVRYVQTSSKLRVLMGLGVFLFGFLIYWQLIALLSDTLLVLRKRS